MELTVINKLAEGNRTHRTEAYLRRHLEFKLGKIEQRWGKAVVARVTTEESPVGFSVTVALTGDHEIVARSFNDKLPKAVDSAVDKIVRQFEVNAEKREGRERQRRTPLEKAPTEF